MTGTTHRLAGITSGVVIIDNLHISDIKLQTIVLGGCILGSLIPDIDNPQSTISYRIPMARYFFGLMQNMIRIFSNLLPNKQRSYVRSCIGHRGFTHSFFAIILIPVLANLIIRIAGFSDNLFSLGLGIGLLSHIILDLFSGGTRLLLPFTDINIKITKIRTGGILEILIRFVLLCFLINCISTFIVDNRL